MRSGRILAFSAPGFAAAVTLMMVLSPMAAASITHPTILKPAYRGTVSTPTSSVSLSGCVGSKAVKPTWNPKTGNVSIGNSLTARTCKTSLGGVGSSSYAYSSAGVSIAIPFMTTTGNHLIGESWTVNVASAMGNTVGGCPVSNVVFPTPMNTTAYSYCESQSELSFFASAYVVDLNNGSWFSNFSYASVYTYALWENFTYCYNYGMPGCSNTTGNFNSSSAFGYNAGGLGAWTWNGATTFVLWTNGTGMVRGHHYALIITVSDDKYAFAGYYNVKSYWAAGAFAAINMLPPTHGAKLNTVVIV